jgi:hypothetical protein
MTEDKNIDHSRLLDVHRHSDYPEVNDFVNAFWEQHVAAYFKATLGKRGPKSKAQVQGQAQGHVQGALSGSVCGMAGRS